VLLLAYRDRDVYRTCVGHDDAPDWTGNRPAPVLGLSLAWGAAAVMTLPLMLYPAVPVFGRLVTGLPGVLLTLGGAVLCAVLARSTFRLQRAAWWGSTLALTLLGVSTFVTLLRVGVADYLRAMNYPEEQVTSLPTAVGAIALWSTVALTVVSLAYLLSIRRHFGGDGFLGVR